MPMIARIITFILIFVFSSKHLFAADIPIIVIAPSQKAQSKSTVGTSVTVFEEASIENSSDFFLGDVLGNGTTSFNYFQQDLVKVSHAGGVFLLQVQSLVQHIMAQGLAHLRVLHLRPGCI